MSTLLNDVDLVDRILAHVDGHSTDKGTSVWREPAANYTLAERFAAELEVLRRVPMAFCPSAALPEPAPTSRARPSARRFSWCGAPTAIVRGSATPAATAA